MIPNTIGTITITQPEADDFARMLLDGSATEAEVAEAIGCTEFDAKAWRLKFDPFTPEEKDDYAALGDKVNIKELARVLGVSYHTVLGWRRSDTPIRRAARSNTGSRSDFTAEERQLAVDMVREGHSYKEAASAIDASIASVVNWCKREEVGDPVKSFSPEEKREALQRVAAGEPLSRIASEMGMSTATVSRWASDHGLKVRRGRPPVPDEKRAEILAYAEMRTVREAAERFGVSQVAIFAWKRAATA